MYTSKITYSRNKLNFGIDRSHSLVKIYLGNSIVAEFIRIIFVCQVPTNHGHMSIKTTQQY